MGRIFDREWTRMDANGNGASCSDAVKLRDSESGLACESIRHEIGWLRNELFCSVYVLGGFIPVK
jgi:hypothetical protein